MSSRSQRALRYREVYDMQYVSAYMLGEPSLRTQAEQRAARVAQGFTAGTPPANTVAPAITGTLTVGQVQTATNGTWTAQGGPTYTRQWYRGNTPIAGATNTTYTLVTADQGFPIFCRVTATDTTYLASAVADSNVRLVPVP